MRPRPPSSTRTETLFPDSTLFLAMQVAGPNPLPAVVVGDQTVSRVVGHAFSATGTEIPARARAAYQRATLVMADASSTCRMSWPLLAAVGDRKSTRLNSSH